MYVDSRMIKSQRDGQNTDDVADDTTQEDEEFFADQLSGESETEAVAIILHLLILAFFRFGFAWESHDGTLAVVFATSL